MHRLMGLAYLPMQERSAFMDALLPARNHGVVLSGATASDNVSWAVGAFNNWIDSGVSFSDTSNQVVGRTTWAPARFQDERNLLHLGFGLRYSDARRSFRIRSEPEFDIPEPRDNPYFTGHETAEQTFLKAWMSDA